MASQNDAADTSSRFQSITQFDESSAQQLGKGAFGLVRAMQCLGDGKVYAVKSVNIGYVMHQATDQADADRMKQSIFNEAKVIRGLKHVNLVKVYGSFLDGDEDSGTFYIVMKLCDGGALKTLIREAKADFEEPRVLDWASQLINGVKYLHAHKILHRDIKAENVFLDAALHLLKIGDFGISKVSEKTAISARTAIGTISHMAPEILKGGSAVWRSDVWSLGVVLYNICVRKLPFDAGAPAVVKAIIDDDVAIPAIAGNYSSELRQAVANRMLVRDPNERATIQQLSMEPPFVDHVRRLDKEFDLVMSKKEIVSLEKQLLSERKDVLFMKAENERLKQELAIEADRVDKFREDILKLGQENEKLNRQNHEYGREIEAMMKKLQRSSNAIYFGSALLLMLTVLLLFPINPILNEELNGLKIEIEMFKSQKASLMEENEKIKQNHQTNLKFLGGLLPKRIVPKVPLRIETRLCDAALNGDLKEVERLLENGADPNSVSNGGFPALFRAAGKGHIDVVKQLLANGADVNSKYKIDGASVLYVAAQEAHLDVVKLLLANGADVNSKNKIDGASVLYIAAQEAHLDVVKLLLANGADVNSKRKDGVSVLYIAAQKGHIDVVKQLLANGADVNSKWKDGWTPLMIASHHGHTEIVNLLKTNGAK